MWEWFRPLMAALLIWSAPAYALADDYNKTGQKLGPLKPPAGGVAYRVTWDGYWDGFIEATETADGHVQMRRSQLDGSVIEVPLHLDDLKSFEAELVRSPFTSTREYRGQLGTCLDECSYFYLTVSAGGSSKTLPVEVNAGVPTVRDAVDELIELADARSGALNGRPEPWWARDDSVHSYPTTARRNHDCAADETVCAHSAWETQLASAGLTDLWAPTTNEWSDRVYRLVWFPTSGPAKSVQAVLKPGGECLLARRAPVPEMCQDHLLISTSTQSAPRLVAASDAWRFEDALYKAGFSTMASDSASGCATGARWVLEAHVHGRYRFVAGSMCDDRGLGLPTAQLRHWARWD